MAIHHVEAPDGTILAVDAPEGVPPDDITRFAMSNYIASQRQQEAIPEPAAPPPEPQDGDFIRGLKSYVPSIKETFGGAQVLAGKALGSESLTQAGVERVRGAQAEQKGKKTDDLTEAWDQGIGTVLTDWLPYQIGSGVGNIAESVAMAGIGSLFGGAVGGAGGIFAKSMVKKGIKEAAKDIIEDQIAKGATKEAAKEAGAKYVAEMGAKELEESAAKFLAKQGGKAYGATAGIGAQALLHGMGETTSRALQEAGMNPEQMDMGALMTAVPIHTVADFVSDKILLGGLRGMNLGGLSEKSTGKLVYDVLKGAAKTGAKEIIPEDIQSAAERYGAQMPLASADAISEYINTAGAAFAMSVLPGGVGGVRTYAGRQITPRPEGAPPVEPGVEPVAGVSEAADEGARIRQMEEERAREAGIIPPEEPAASPAAEPTVAPSPLPTAQKEPAIPEAAKQYVDTRGTSARFHGTSNEINSLSDQYALSGDNRNIYGQGFHTTDALDVSQGYTKKGKGTSPTVYEVTHKDVPLYNMEQPINQDVMSILERQMGMNLPETNYETGKPLSNLREVFDEYRAESKELGLSRDDVQDTFDAIRADLEQLGYRGYEHAGGLQTGKQPHNVKIFWNPEQDVQIQKADLSKYEQNAKAEAALPENVHPLEAWAEDGVENGDEIRKQATAAANNAGIDVKYGVNKIDTERTTLDWSKFGDYKNIDGLLKHIRDHVPLDYKEIIDRILPSVKGIPISTTGYINGAKSAKAAYIPMIHVPTGKVISDRIEFSVGQGGNDISSIVHEATHGATIQNYYMGKAGNQKYAAAAKDLDKLTSYLLKNYGDRIPFMQKDRNGKSLYPRKAFSRELITWALTDEETRNVLKSIELPNKQTAWSKFVQVMAKLIGLPNDKATALHRVLDITDRLIDQRKAPAAQTSGQVRQEIDTKIPVQEEVIPSVSPHKSYTGGPAPQASWGIKGFSEMSSFGKFADDLAYKYLDKHKDMKDVLKAIAATGRKVSATWDAYMRETLYHNRVAYMVKQFINNEVKPLAQDMVKLGITEQDLHNYLLARHAAEYNKEMNDRNDSPYIQNRGSGVHTLIAGLYMGQIPKSEKANVLAQVGELNENEKALIKDLDSMTPQQMKNLQAMAKKIDNITARTQDITVAGGLETPETVQYWRDKYPHYVPLKRDPEELDFVSTNLGMGQGFSTRAGVGKAAVGSTKTVDNILSNIMLQRDIAITRAEKARIGRALYGMFLQNPNPGFVLPVNPSVGIVGKANELAAKIAADRAKLNDMIKDPAADPEVMQELRDKIDAQQALYNRMKPQADAAQAAMIDELIKSGMVPDGVDPVAFAENMIKEPEGAFYNEKTGKVEYRTNAFLRSSKNVLAIPINGETRYLFFNPSDERAMRMINALKNNDIEKIGEFTQMVAKATRWISAVNTQYNPFFGILNMLRDVQGAQFNLSTTALKGEQLAVNSHIVPSLFAIYKSLRGERAGTEVDSQYAKEWHEFQKLGGPTGYKDMIGRERDQLSVLAEEIKKLNEGEAKAISRKAFDAIVGRMSDFNDSMENAVRLSAFIEAKKKFASQGMNATEAADKAAELAKNLTVNFNRKGQKTALVNSWYAFFNAAAQGSARLYETVRGPAGKKIMGSLILLGVMQSLLLKAAGFEDDDPPEFVREKNFVIPAGDGKYLSWPLPLGFNVFTNFGRLSSDIVTDILYNNGRHAADKAVAMASTLSNTFNPFGSSGLSIQTLAPSVVDPLAAIAENRDAFGRPIHRSDMATKPTPGYLRSREGTSDIANFFAAALNRMSGGTEFQKGAISPTGDDIEYLAGQVGGGTWREGRKLFGLVTKPEGEEIPPYKIPLYGRFVGDTGAKANISNQFYQNVTQLASYGQEIEGRVKNKQEFQSFLQDHPEARMYKTAANVYNKISDLNHTKKMLIEHNAPKSQIQQVEDAKINIMKMFNERVKEAQQ